MGGTLWIDDLYMGCPVLLKLYQYTGNKQYLEDAIYQIKTYASYAQDQDGLYYHGYFFEENEPSACKWGRANGWTIIAMVETLSMMPEEHPEKEALMAILKKHIDGLVSSQDSSGLWHQVLDHPELWLETSCTSMFAYAITRAVNRRWMGRDYLPYAKKAFEGINTRITEDGGIIGISEGSGIGRDLEFYINRKRPFDGHHGPGPVLLALTELLLSEQNSLSAQ
jgi:rhamnogalacturonyl hydrolase YesR